MGGLSTARGPGPSRPRVLVVGGGVIGVSCAYWLARRGAAVELLERGRIASGASFGNAGTIAAGHPPLNRPGRVRQALLGMLDRGSPLYVPPRWDPGLWAWLWRFARHCTREHVSRAMRVLAPLGHEALATFERLVVEESLDCGWTKEGYYDVCRTSSGLRAAKQEAELIREHGYNPEVLDGDELRRREPALGPVTMGGVHYPEAATVDPLRFTRALAARARERGVRIREGAVVREVRVTWERAAGVLLASGDMLHADAVVLATGPFDMHLYERLGSKLPVEPGKGYHRDVAVGEGGAPPLRITCVLHESSVFCTPMDGVVRFAGTLEFSGHNEELVPKRLEQLTRSARRYMPALGDGPPVSEWCGLRPMSADGLPIVGPLPDVHGVVAATGHGKLGLTLGPVTGRIVADHVLGGSEGPLYTELSPSRFEKDE